MRNSRMCVVGADSQYYDFTLNVPTMSDCSSRPTLSDAASRLNRVCLDVNDQLPSTDKRTGEVEELRVTHATRYQPASEVRLLQQATGAADGTHRVNGREALGSDTWKAELVGSAT